MKRSFWVLILLTANGTALAEERAINSPPAPCPSLVEHQPAPDVAYQPGIDTGGWAVEPADLYPPSSLEEELNDKVKIDLELPLENYTDTRHQAVDLSRADIELGELEVKKDSITLNGKNIAESNDEGILQPGCAQE